MAHDKVDWSQQKYNADAWAVDDGGTAHWLVFTHFAGSWELTKLPAPLFGYEGKSYESLTPRPQE